MADDQTADAPGLNFGSVISEKITDSIRNMDVLTVLQKMVATTPEDEESEEIREKLKGVLEQFNAMSEDDQASFTAQIKEGLANKLSMRLKESGNINLGGLEDAIRDAVVTKLYVVGAAVLFIILLLVFFGYKLYKSLKEKEMKKEEKKKAKLMKKKK